MKKHNLISGVFLSIHRNKITILAVLILNIFVSVQSQNAIVGTGFSTGWGSGCTSPNGTNYTYLNASIGTTYSSGDLTPNGTGNQYWRFAVGWSSTYFQIGGGSDIAVTPGIKSSSIVSCAEIGAWYTNVSSLSNRYIFKTLNAGVSPTGTWVFFELGGSSATVTGVSQSPLTVNSIESVNVTATLSTPFPTGQGAYLRYSTDNFATSTVVTMSGSGTSYSATIPSHSSNTIVKYYVFTSGSGLTISGSDADLYTINYNNNAGNNYGYTVSLIRSVLIDFGSNTGTNVLTTSPSSGNYWNNFTYNGLNGTSPSSFIDKTNSATTFNAIATNSNFSINTGSTLGLSTGLNTSNLGELAEANAATDCFFSNSNIASLKFTGLSTIRRYKFYIFGCRTATDTRVTKYTLTGSTSTFGTLTTSGTNIGGTGINGNNSSLYSSIFLNANGSGEIALDVTNNAGSGFGYLNSLKMEEYKGIQTITFTTLPSKTVSDIDFSPGATSTTSATNPISYSSSNTAVATIVNNQIHIVGAGTTDITASQVANTDYDAATNITQTLTVSSLQSQTITFGALSAKNYGDANFDLTASASSSLAVSFSSSNTAVATVSGNTVTIVGAGTTDITASQVGNGTFAPASNVIQTLTVNKLNQTITFGVLSAKTDADAPFTISPSSTSGLTITLASSNSNVALVNGYTITIVGAGSSVITASQTGNTTYNAATSVPQTLTVSSAMTLKQSLYFDFGPNETTNGDVTLNPDANGNYWNNITPSAGGAGVTAGTAVGTLKNSSNITTAYGLTFTNGGFTTNGKLNGGLLTPFTSQFGSNSELAIATATEDYIYTGALEGSGSVITFSGLNPAKKYKFKIFGSRNISANRTAQYTLQGLGAASVGTLQSSSIAGLGGSVFTLSNYEVSNNQSYKLANDAGSYTTSNTYFGNNSTVYTSGLVEPDGSGSISLTTITTTPSSAFAYINCMKIEEYQQASTWSGTGNWSDVANWSNSPNIGADITVSSGELTINQSANIDRITLAPGAKLTLGNGNTLTATSGITLQSDATGTATFVDTNNSSPQATTGTVQQYLTDQRNWYTTSPISAGTAAGLNLGTSVQTYSESAKSWTILTGSDALVTGKGYVSVATTGTGTTGTVSFNGTLNTGTISVPVTRTESGSSRGFNLVANPYPSYLDWSLVTADGSNANIGSTMWFRTKNTLGAYTFATHNGTSGETVTGTANTTITKFIPPLQAFWIRVNANVGQTTYSTSISFKNSMRAHRDDNGNKLKAPKLDERKRLRLQVSNGAIADETLLYFDANAQDSFDNYDSPKMFNNTTSVPEIYTQVSAEKLVINGLNEVKYNTEIPLGFATAQANDFSIKTTEYNNFEAGTKVILKDKLNPSTEFELSEGAVYNFSSQVTTPTTDRFSLLFRAPGVTTEIDNATKLNVQVFVNANNQITIIAPEKTAYSIYNGVGQLIENGILNSKLKTIYCKLTQGVYVVKVADVSKRVIIK